MSTNWAYKFSATLTEPPTGDQVRFDAAHPYTAVAKVWVRNVNSDGVDVHNGLMLTAVGSTLYLQDKNDHTQYAAFVTIAAPVDKTDYVELPVAWVANGVALTNNQAIEFATSPPNVTPPTPTPYYPPSGGSWYGSDDDVCDPHMVSVLEVARTGAVWTDAEAKLYARLAGADLDPLWPTFVNAACEKVETDSSQSLLTQTRRVWFDEIPSATVTLPPRCWPVQSVEVAYVTTANAQVIVDPASYQVDAASQPPRIRFLTVGTTPSDVRSFQPVTMKVVAGYLTPDVIPGPLRHAVGLLAGFYANESGDRFLAADLWDQYEDTIQPYRLVVA
jgi:uncharacterized phiE125 gp8 family phage protein